MRAFPARRGRHSAGLQCHRLRRLPPLLQCGVGLSVALAGLSPALATDTVTYAYDARGRLVHVTHSGTAPNNAVAATYSYDDADNRTNVSVTTNGACSGVTFAVGNASAAEGASLSFAVTKTGSTADSCSVNYTTGNGTAVAPGDYTTTSGTLSFTSAQASKTVSVATVNDSAVETSETVKLFLSNATGAATIADTTGVGTITDNDVPPVCSGVNFTVASNGALTEGANSVFTISKHGTATGSCAVNYATANGTAASPGDYTAKSGTLTFTSTQTSQTVSVATVNNTAVESGETFKLNLSSPTNGAVLGTPSSATATINDNDQVSFSISNSQANEGNPLVFEVTKSGSATGTVTVSFATSDDSASSVFPGDYTPVSGTLTFAVTDTVKTITVNTLTDLRTETNETMDVTLSNPSAGTIITDGQAVGTIFNVDSSGGTGGCGRACR